MPSFYALEVQRALRGRASPTSQSSSAQAAEAAGARLAWPAPDDPARAIDEIEHDLAALGALAAAGARRERAGGRAICSS